MTYYAPPMCYPPCYPPAPLPSHAKAWVIGAAATITAAGLAVGAVLGYNQYRHYQHDSDFVVTLAHDGIQGDRGLLIDQAHQVCLGFQQIETGRTLAGRVVLQEVEDKLGDARAIFTDDQLVTFAIESSKAYCPDAMPTPANFPATGEVR
jgi:hypothetical protein